VTCMDSVDDGGLSAGLVWRVHNEYKEALEGCLAFEMVRAAIGSGRE
jgi:hypothetical protein